MEEIEDKIEKKLKEIGGQLADKASACQNMAFAFGSAIAPVMGGKLTDVYGFQATSDIMAEIALVFAFANFCIVYLPKLVQANKSTQIKVVNNSSTLSF